MLPPLDDPVVTLDVAPRIRLSLRTIHPDTAVFQATGLPDLWL